MYSTPKLHRFFGASILGLAFIGGCTSMPDSFAPEAMRHGYTPGFEQHVNRIARPSQGRLDPVLPDPAPDEASTLRGWAVQAYKYPSGAVVAFPTYAANFEDRPVWMQYDATYAAMSPGIMLADVGAMPFWMIVEPPATEVNYHGVQYAPSMTVAPPLPKQ